VGKKMIQIRDFTGKKMIQIRDFYVPVYFIYVLAQSLGGARNTPERSTM
jgi:hypothetical protein